MMKAELPKRRRIRLENFDYSTCALYFLTICIRCPEISLWQSVGANIVRPQLSETGYCVRRALQNISEIYSNVTVTDYCIMPDHIHCILWIHPDDDGRTMFAPTVSRVVKQFKGAVTKQVGFSIWQKSFYDHILRNDKAYQQAVDYIYNNPIRGIAAHETDS